MEQPNYNKIISRMLIIFAVILILMFVLIVIRDSKSTTIEEQYCKQSGGKWNLTDCNYKDGTSKTKEQISLEINRTV